MRIAIVGATGLVGREMLKIIYERGLNKNSQIELFASKKSDGVKLSMGDETLIVKELKEENLSNSYDYALFSAGKDVSRAYEQMFIYRGAYVIDNSSAFRRCNNVPLVVPEINFNSIKESKLIANPNCSTIGCALVLSAISKKYKIKRVVVSTYQAVSGAGQKGVNDLKNKTNIAFSHEICNNLIPQIDKPLSNGYTFEEDKMDFELKKILNNKRLKVCATCVRVPILNCHSESVNIELDRAPNLDEINELLSGFTGIKLCNNLELNEYPMPYNACGKDDVFVGRVRLDTSHLRSINLFLCFDNIRKGASLNAVQIMEKLIKMQKS